MIIEWCRPHFGEPGDLSFFYIALEEPGSTGDKWGTPFPYAREISCMGMPQAMLMVRETPSLLTRGAVEPRMACWGRQTEERKGSHKGSWISCLRSWFFWELQSDYKGRQRLKKGRNWGLQPKKRPNWGRDFQVWLPCFSCIFSFFMLFCYLFCWCSNDICCLGVSMFIFS